MAETTEGDYYAILYSSSFVQNFVTNSEVISNSNDCLIKGNFKNCMKYFLSEWKIIDKL